MIERLKRFFDDVSKEMKKVNWPSKEQLQESTMVVVTTCLVVGAIVFIVDTVMAYLVGLMYS